MWIMSAYLRRIYMGVFEHKIFRFDDYVKLKANLPSSTCLHLMGFQMSELAYFIEQAEIKFISGLAFCGTGSLT